MPAKRRNLGIQYLGIPGVTHACEEAMVSILTSPYPCREITMLYCRPYPDADFYGVSFVVWGWLGREVTIVPDGFGTHGGTGGWGLALVLELIEFYKIPLKEKWLDDARQFERINFGYPTERDLRDLHHFEESAPSWPAFMKPFGPHLWLAALPEPHFPYWLLLPDLAECAKGVEQDPDSAVFRTVKALEVIIRRIGGFDAHLVGEDLVNQAMGAGKPLAPRGATPAETQAWANLFRGAIGAFKNPQSHRDVKLKMRDAAAQIVTVNLLLRKLREDFPEKFKEEEAEEVQVLDDAVDEDEVDDEE